MTYTDTEQLASQPISWNPVRKGPKRGEEGSTERETEGSAERGKVCVAKKRNATASVMVNITNSLRSDMDRFHKEKMKKLDKLLDLMDQKKTD